MDETDVIEFTTYRFPNKKFLLTKQDLNKYRGLERKLIIKELELYGSIKHTEIKED